MGVRVDGFNCFVFYMGSVEKCCFLFGDLRKVVFNCDALKRFAMYARSECSLTVASTENSSFAELLKTLGTAYVPEKERGLSQVPLVNSAICLGPMFLFISTIYVCSSIRRLKYFGYTSIFSFELKVLAFCIKDPLTSPFANI